MTKKVGIDSTEDSTILLVILDLFVAIVSCAILQDKLNTIWNAIDDAFGDYWNNVLGMGGDIYFDQFFDFISDRLKEKHILLLPDNLGQILTIMFDFIEMIGGFLDDPRCPNYEFRDKIVNLSLLKPKTK